LNELQSPQKTLKSLFQAINRRRYVISLAAQRSGICHPKEVLADFCANSDSGNSAD